MTARATLFGLGVATASIVAMALFIKRRVLKLVLIGPPRLEGFVKGFEQSCRDMDSVPHVVTRERPEDVTDESRDQIVMVTSHPTEFASCPLVTFDISPQTPLPNTVAYNISRDMDEMLDMAIQSAPGVGKAVFIVQAATLPPIDKPGCITVHTKPHSAMMDIVAAAGMRSVEAIIVVSPELAVQPAIKDMLSEDSNTKPVLIACGFHQSEFDKSIYQDPYEQGYLAGVLAINMLNNRKLFAQRTVRTQIYTHED
jgi:hypothetical protein